MSPGAGMPDVAGALWERVRDFVEERAKSKETRFLVEVVSTTADGKATVRRPGDPAGVRRPPMPLIGVPRTDADGKQRAWAFANENGMVVIGEESPFPPGFLAPYAGAAAPRGWLLCAGQALARADYPRLFEAIGIAYNVGNEAPDAFRLPDFRGRTAVGAGQGAGLTYRERGDRFGSEAVGLSLAHIPNHDHGGAVVAHGGHSHSASAVANHTHGGTAAVGNHDHGAITGYNGGHDHGGVVVPAGAHGHGYIAPAPVTAVFAAGTNKAGVASRGNVTTDGVGDHNHGIPNIADHRHVIALDGAHSHGIGGDGAHSHTLSAMADHSHTIAAQGGGAEHANAQPSLAVPYIIKI